MNIPKYTVGQKVKLNKMSGNDKMEGLTAKIISIDTSGAHLPDSPYYFLELDEIYTFTGGSQGKNCSRGEREISAI